MDQRLSVITLGVEDVAASTAFYQRLGWEVTFTDGDIVMFQAGPVIVSLWSRDKLAADSGVEATPDAWGGFTIGLAVGGQADVDTMFGEAIAAGGTATRPPVEKGFGYSGVFADLDGVTWEIAWIKGLTPAPDGSVSLRPSEPTS
jgi:predicted lactoylglutathione lyase